MTSLAIIQRSRKVESLPKVRGFLESISRNSVKSKKSYSSGITLFQKFLDYNKQQQEEAHQEREKYQDYSCETILQSLIEARLSIYELFNDFVSFILTTKADITPKSVSLYITAIRSYFAYYDIDVIPSKFKRKVKMPKFYREDEEAERRI